MKCGFVVVSSVKLHWCKSVLFQKLAFQSKIVDERGPMKQNKHFTQASTNFTTLKQQTNQRHYILMKGYKYEMFFLEIRNIG